MAKSLSTKKHNEQVKKKRDILMRLIVAALYLARQEQAFRGHSEATGSANRGNFVELVQTFVEFDTEVFKLLQRMLTITATSASAERSFSFLKRNKTEEHMWTGQAYKLDQDIH